MQESIFTKIIKGEIPCHKVYEDKQVLAFLDINPIAEGHTLVIPKKQVEFVWELDEESYGALMSAVKKVANRLNEIMPAKYIGELIVGTDVPHAHVHLIPFDTAAQMKRSLDGPGASADQESLAELAKKLRF